MKSTLTQAYLHSILSYDKDTGLFTRLVSTNSRCKIGEIVGSNCNGYIRIYIGKYGYYAHRLAFLYVNGDMSIEVDHKNRNKSDNRWDNLREVTKTENKRNSPLHKNNKSGVCGVMFSKVPKKWLAYIRVNKKFIHLGLFIGIEDAIIARKNAEVLYGFHPTHGLANV